MPAKVSPRSPNTVTFDNEDLQGVYSYMVQGGAREYKAKVADKNEIFDIEYVALAKGAYICTIFDQNEFWVWSKDKLDKAMTTDLSKAVEKQKAASVVKFKGAFYKPVAQIVLAFRTKSSIPKDMRDEYGFAAIGLNGEEVNLLAQLHEGQSDPVYALMSRANSGPTWVSKDELESVVSRLQWFQSEADAGKLEAKEEELETANFLEYEFQNLVDGKAKEYPEGVVREFDMDDVKDSGKTTEAETASDPLRGLNINDSYFISSVKSALAEIKKKPEDYRDYGDDAFQYYLEDISSGASGVHQPEEIISFFNLEGEDFGKENEWFWDEIDNYVTPVADALTEKLKAANIPGSIYFGHLEADGSYGMFYRVDEDAIAEEIAPRPAVLDASTKKTK